MPDLMILMDGREKEKERERERERGKEGEEEEEEDKSSRFHPGLLPLVDSILQSFVDFLVS